MQTLARTLLVLAAGILASPALAQDHERNWENGSVVQVTEVHIKDGMFNAYINDLDGLWRRFLERQMEDGDVLDYGMYSNANPRQDEPDLYLTVVYKNWAAFDRGADYFEEISEDLMGSLDNMRQAGIDRGELREIGSTYALQEITFTTE